MVIKYGATTPSITKLSKMSLSTKFYNIGPKLLVLKGAMTLSITTLSITTISIMTLSITTLSAKGLVNNTQHN